MDINIEKVSLENAYDLTGEISPRLLGIRQWEAVVALGKPASDVLKKLEIKHFKMPHPSGLNRQLNDKQEISRLLYRCKKFIYK